MIDEDFEHEQRAIHPDLPECRVDAGIADLILELIRRDYQTAYSCEHTSRGAYIVFHGSDTWERLIYDLSTSVEIPLELQETWDEMYYIAMIESPISMLRTPSGGHAHPSWDLEKPENLETDEPVYVWPLWHLSVDNPGEDHMQNLPPDHFFHNRITIYFPSDQIDPMTEIIRLLPLPAE